MEINAVLYCASWQAVTFLMYILEVTDSNLNGILTVLAEIICSLPQSVQAVSGNFYDKHVNAMKTASVEDCNRYMCFVTMPQNDKHLLHKV
jgi:hypothetical protein